MFKNLEAGGFVAVSVVPDKKAEICKIVCLTERIVVVKYLSKKWTYGEFDRKTGARVKSEEFGKLLGDDDLAVKEAPEVICPHSHCGVSNINFFTAKEFLQGGKNFNCYQCKGLIFLRTDGRFNKVLPTECES